MIDPTKRRETKRALAEIELLTKKYMDQGMTREEARDRAYKDRRDNPRMDYRRMKKLPDLVYVVKRRSAVRIKKKDSKVRIRKK
jgi:hypothetical protein